VPGLILEMFTKFSHSVILIKWRQNRQILHKAFLFLRSFWVWLRRQFLNIYWSEKCFLPTLWSKLEAKLHIYYKFSVFIVCCFCSQRKENESVRNIALYLQLIPPSLFFEKTEFSSYSLQLQPEKGSIHYVVPLVTCKETIPKRVVRNLRSIAVSFYFLYLLFSLRQSSSGSRLRLRLFVSSFFP
jgi:hypothetical protein